MLIDFVKGAHMVTQEGIVQTISGRNATVSIIRSEACAGCASRGVCQTLSDKEILVEVVNDARAKEGDRVEISVPSRVLFKVSVLIYFLPIVALIVGASIGGACAESLHVQSNLASILGGVIAMGITFCVLTLIDRNAKSKAGYHPRMTRILSNPDSPSELT